jgi:hypothetical protein
MIDPASGYDPRHPSLPGFCRTFKVKISDRELSEYGIRDPKDVNAIRDLRDIMRRAGDHRGVALCDRLLEAAKESDYLRCKRDRDVSKTGV